VNAALNNRIVFLYKNEHGGERHVDFVRGFKGHNIAKQIWWELARIKHVNAHVTI